MQSTTTGLLGRSAGLRSSSFSDRDGDFDDEIYVMNASDGTEEFGSPPTRTTISCPTGAMWTFVCCMAAPETMTSIQGSDGAAFGSPNVVSSEMLRMGVYPAEFDRDHRNCHPVPILGGNVSTPSHPDLFSGQQATSPSSVVLSI